MGYCTAAALQVGGLLLVAPEHRLSLLLKSMEIWGKGDHQLHDQLQQLMALRYQDILDESDELLHHRYVHDMYKPPPCAAHTTC